MYPAMLKRNPLISAIVVCLLIVQTPILRAESVDDPESNISPKHSPGTGEFVHGQGYGKILMRVLMLGAVGSQGVHYVPEGTDLTFALLYSGGILETTKLNGISIRRRGIKEPMHVDLDDDMGDGKPILKLMDGDVINVPYNWRRDTATISLIKGFIGSMVAFVTGITALVIANRK